MGELAAKSLPTATARSAGLRSKTPVTCVFKLLRAGVGVAIKVIVRR